MGSSNKYPRISQYNKPIIIVELGVSDTPENQKNWLADAFAVAPDYPLIKALIYFNTQDIHSWKKWGAKGAPNWSINPALFTQPLAANQFPLEWTLEEFEQHFGKSTGISDPSRYTFDNEESLSVLDGGLSENRPAKRSRRPVLLRNFLEGRCLQRPDARYKIIWSALAKKPRELQATPLTRP